MCIQDFNFSFFNKIEHLIQIDRNGRWKHLKGEFWKIVKEERQFGYKLSYTAKMPSVLLFTPPRTGKTRRNKEQKLIEKAVATLIENSQD